MLRTALSKSHHLRFLSRDEAGVTAIEYALIGAFIFVVIIASVSSMQDTLKTMYGMIANTVLPALKG